MAELISGLRSQTVRANLERVRAEVAAARQKAVALGRTLSARDAATGGAAATGVAAGDQAAGDVATSDVEVLAATKYVSVEDMPVLAQAGARLVGENRAQDLSAKVAAHDGLFEWDFIGALQSRRVRLIVPHVRLIHSVASDSALRELARHRESARPGLRILIEVNVAGEPGKAGVAPHELDEFIARSALPVAGLMTMPPLAADPDDSRPWFAALRGLADERWLEHLSMGTSQDYVVAVEEGATIVRIGTKLYR